MLFDDPSYELVNYVTEWSMTMVEMWGEELRALTSFSLVPRRRQTPLLFDVAGVYMRITFLAVR